MHGEPEKNEDEEKQEPELVGWWEVESIWPAETDEVDPDKE